MARKPEPPGCRGAAIGVAILVGSAVVFMAIGLTLVNDSGCNGACETLGFTLLYAGLPISAVFGVVFGDLVVAWPLDVTFWVVIAFLLARRADNRGHGVLGVVLAALGLAIVYGLVLSQLVEIAT